LATIQPQRVADAVIDNHPTTPKLITSSLDQPTEA
jgi:hypothetical protein